MNIGDTLVEEYLEHEYDPIKAREYYLRTRKLKGRAKASDVAKAKEYESKVTADAQVRLNADLKKAPKVVMNKKRRIGAAEQKLIRAKSLASRIVDPVVRRDALEKIANANKKVTAVKDKMAAKPGAKAATKPDAKAAAKIDPKAKPAAKATTKPKPKPGAKPKPKAGVKPPAKKTVANRRVKPVSKGTKSPQLGVSKTERLPSVKGKPKREKVTYKDGSSVTYEGDKEVGTTPPTRKAKTK